MANELIQKFDNLTIWRRRDERAPHKPLLALWAIGRCLQGSERLVEFDVIHKTLLNLLQSFGPPRKSYKTHEPFWRMQKDQIWEVTQAHRVPVQPNGSVSPAILRELHVSGGLRSTLYDLFRHDPSLALGVAKELVVAHFPKTMWFAVLEATLGEYAQIVLAMESPNVEIENSTLLASTLNRRIRDRNFRARILSQYNHKCAVCSYSFEFPSGHWPALEAAHIKWHSHRGPNTSENGLSLCVLHHELFDWGIFTIQPNTLNISVASSVLQKQPTNAISRLHGLPLQVTPEHANELPAAEYLNWHTNNVFRP